MKKYEIDGDLQEWVLSNRDIVHTVILEECEYAVSNKTYTTENANIKVLNLRSKDGYSLVFCLESIPEIIESLTKAMNYYADTENYEYAIRSRDCIKNWELQLKNISK